MKTHLLLLATFFVCADFASAQDQAQVTKLLQQLHGTDLEAQSEAIREIGTSLDPRIPEACLPLLQSPGDSIRRNAARAIGSRWHQIPKERVATFVKALKANLKSDNEGLVNMSRRGIALLSRTYDNDLVSRSKSKRWLIYERRGKPCLIDTQNQSEELLGFEVDGYFSPAIGNIALTQSSFWHSKQDMVALETIIFRRTNEIWVWRHPAGLRPIVVNEVMPLLKPEKGAVTPSGGFFMRFAAWTGSALEFLVQYTVNVKEEFTEREARVSWDSEKNTLRVLSDKVAN